MSIPDALKARDQWVNWRAEPRPDGKVNKPPYQANGDGRKLASHADPGTWTSYETAMTCQKQTHASGVGYVFTADDGFVGIDFDDVIDELGQVKPWALARINQLRSYTERTPSGKGFHTILRGSLPGGKGQRRGHIEVYDRLRYFTMTGDHLAGTPETIEPRQAELERFLAEVFGHDPSEKEDTPDNGYRPAEAPVLSPQSSVLGDQALLEKALNSKTGDRFSRLWAGDWSGYQSQSEADQALCNDICFWWGPDAGTIDRMFRQSGLYRDKWNRADYREATIGTAISGTAKRYTGVRPAQKGAIEAPANEIVSIGPEEQHQYHLTDLGNAKRFVAMHGRSVGYIHAWNTWILWNGCAWERDETEETTRLAKTTALSIYREASETSDENMRQALAKHAVRSEAEPRIKAMLSLAESEPGIPVKPDMLDADPMLLNCQNGIVDLKTSSLLPHDRTLYNMKYAPVEYDLDARCDVWLAFLDRIMNGNRCLIEFLQTAIGYSLTGSTSERVMFLLHGTGANGKTTLLETIRAMMGTYAMRTPSETLLIKRDGNIPNDIARLKGARFVSASETEAGRRLAESMVKDVTGQDTVTARFLYAELFEYLPEFKLWLGTNHKPVIRGTENAIWDRIRLIPFTVTIPEAERDRCLKAKLLAELSGILNWAVEGCLKWQEKGLSTPTEVRDATGAYRQDMDVLAAFLGDKCEIGDQLKAPTGALYQAYINWCTAGNEKPESQRTFSMALAERGFEPKQQGGVRMWKGLRLVPNAETTRQDDLL